MFFSKDDGYVDDNNLMITTLVNSLLSSGQAKNLRLGKIIKSIYFDLDSDAI